MRTVLAFSMLFLALCVGCPNTAVDKEKPTMKPTEKQEPPKTEGHVEPMHLPDGTKVGDTETQETTGVPSEIFGKYAAETVPLPPVEDLTTQVDEYITKIGRFLEDLDGSPKYADDAADIVRDTHALSLVALAIGLTEADSKYKKSASQIITAAKTLAAAKNIDEGRKAYAALQASLTGSGNGKPLAWKDKIADLKPLMKALPNLNSSVKRITDTERKLNIALSGANPQRVYGQLAALSVISQGSIPNVTETTKPDAVEEWKKLCEEFRDAALNTNAAAHQYAKDTADGKEPNYAAFSTCFKAMTESCDNCHKVFYPSAVGKE
jgi:hypothetical protein